VRPDLDEWIAEPVVRVSHRRVAEVEPARLWAAAREVRLADTRMLGRLVRWRIPGVPASIAYDELFRAPPFTVLRQDDEALVAGLVGRIWTLRRDYPELAGPDAFRAWSQPGTTRVVFANWAEQVDERHSALVSETRVAATDRDGHVGLNAVRPLIGAFHALIGREALAAATRRAETRVG
jgi:hypothetical protein